MSLKPKKSLGQHFLTDPVVVFQIVNAIVAEGEMRTIEIGAGTGALTESLLQKFEDVHAVEIDERAVNILKQKFDELTIHTKDILKIDWDEITASSKKNVVFGNLPYYITSPILFDLLEHRAQLSEAVLMMQKEVAKRLVANPASKEYGILSIQTQLFCTPEILFDVAPQSFSPPPKVDSAVIKLTFNKPRLNCADQSIKKVVRTAFNQRRKKLSNALKPVLGDYQPEGFNLDDRAEHWSPETYAKLAEHLEQTDRLS